MVGLHGTQRTGGREGEREKQEFGRFHGRAPTFAEATARLAEENGGQSFTTDHTDGHGSSGGIKQDEFFTGENGGNGGKAGGEGSGTMD
jgi:hypothetical protein